jgi:hypothetical protein
LRARWAALPFCLPAIQAPSHAFNQIAFKQVYSLLRLCATRPATPFSGFLGGGGVGRFGRSSVVGGLLRLLFVVGIRLVACGGTSV